MASFMLVVWLDGPANASLTRYALVDGVAVAALLTAMALDRKRAEETR